MAYYYVNKNARTDGHHEVHKLDCSHLPLLENRIYLGDFTNCTSAVSEAKKTYEKVNGCFYCSNACHSS